MLPTFFFSLVISSLVQSDVNIKVTFQTFTYINEVTINMIKWCCLEYYVVLYATGNFPALAKHVVETADQPFLLAGKCRL